MKTYYYYECFKYVNIYPTIADKKDKKKKKRLALQKYLANSGVEGQKP